MMMIMRQKRHFCCLNSNGWIVSYQDRLQTALSEQNKKGGGCGWCVRTRAVSTRFVRVRIARPSIRNVQIPDDLRRADAPLQKRLSFVHIFLCLSRACLGKHSASSINVRINDVFRTCLMVLIGPPSSP